MNIHIILVEPAVPENVGAAARAIKTMGFNQLVVVSPSCDILSLKARMLAHGSIEILENAIIAKNIEEIKGRYDFLLATSAKHRSVKYDYFPVAEAKQKICSKHIHINQLGIVFGREESGLTNDETALCDMVSYITMAVSYPSLNLAQAVMLYCYEFKAFMEKEIHIEKQKEFESYRVFEKKLSDFLGTYKINENKTLEGRIFEKLSAMSADDINLLHSLYKYWLAETSKNN